MKQEYEMHEQFLQLKVICVTDVCIYCEMQPTGNHHYNNNTCLLLCPHFLTLFT